VIAAYLAGITLFGLHFRKRQRTLRDYFLADRAIPWWAIALSIVAAETSTLTVISIPGLAYDTNFGFLQVVLGYIVGRIIVSYLFIPHYFRGELFTAYELIDRRFGPTLHRVTAGMFLATRAAAEGVRVFAVSIVVGIAIGTGDVWSIAIILALTLLYTWEGGMTAVIWTDVIQTGIYIGGTLIAVGLILHFMPGGWTMAHNIAASADKFKVFDFRFTLATPYTFWAGLIGGTFLTLGSHGTDQLVVQRLLAARSERESKKALISSGLIVFAQFALFLLVGAMMFAYYGDMPKESFGGADRIYPTFIVTEMPPVVRGLLIAAILAAAMSNLSAALNSLSSSTVVDFYLRRKPKADERQRMVVSRMATVAWAVVLFALALLSRGGGHVVEVGLSIASVAYGSLLGVFLLGVLTKQANERGAILGMACGFATSLYVWLGTKIPWTWYVVIGSVVTFGVGYIASLALEREPERGQARD
jgi:SSS family transporter